MSVVHRPRMSPGGILAMAADRVASNVNAATGQPIDELSSLVACACVVMEGEDVKAAVAALARPGLQTQLIHSLRSQVLEQSRVPEDAVTTLEVVRALERMLEAIAGEHTDDLRARLADPDAFELLVEVAHDLRSPLTSILFLSEALRVGHSGEVNEVQRGQLGLIYSAALGLASVTSDIVDLARGSRRIIDAAPEPYSVAEVFRGVEEMVRPMAEEKRVELRVVVPEFEQSHGHVVAMGRVLLNLTTNALKFTDEGYVEIGVQYRSRSQLEFYVRDTGRGISPERQSELFQPFKKRPSREGHFFSGSGVGLTIARRLVRSMGSDLALETAPGWGTRFSFLIDVPPLH